MNKLFPPSPAILVESLSKFLTSEVKLSLYVAGGCSSILGWLTLLPGSSSVVAETRNLYARAASAEVLGYEPTKYIEKEVSRDLALKAFVNTQRYMYIESDHNIHFDQNRILGVGVTGALRSNYDKAGPHHVYVSLVDQKRYVTYYIVLAKNERTREEEDHFVSFNVLNMINSPITENPTLVGEVLENDKITIVETMETVDAVFPLLSTQVMNIIFLPNGKLLVDQILNKSVVLSESVSSLCDDHVKLRETVAKQYGLADNDLIFEISDLDASNGELTRKKIEEQINLVTEKGFGAMITRRSPFYKKNEYLRQGYFVVGPDAYNKIANPKYYQDSKEVMITKLAEFERSQNKIIIAHRLNSDRRRTITPKNFDVPEIVRPYVYNLSDYKYNVSSIESKREITEQDPEDVDLSPFF